MLTEILNEGMVDIIVSQPSSTLSDKAEVRTILVIKTADTKLEVRFELSATEHEDPWALRLRALRRGMLLYKALWEVLCSPTGGGARELPEPLQERFGGSEYLVYRDADKGVEIRVELARQWELVCEQELQYEQHCQYEEYQDDCLTAAETAVRAYEQVVKQQLNVESTIKG